MHLANAPFQSLVTNSIQSLVTNDETTLNINSRNYIIDYIEDKYRYRVNHILKEESYVKCSLREVYKILCKHEEVTPFHNISCECKFCVVKKSILKLIKVSYTENIDKFYQIELNKNL